MALFNPDVMGTINLSPSQVNKWQTIYGSQLYQTNFAVYAKFQITPKASKPKDPKDPSLIHFAILNYKGILDLGFVNNYRPSFSFETIKVTGKKYGVLKLELKLRAVISEETVSNFDIKIDYKDMEPFYNFISDTNLDGVFLKIDRTLLPMWDCNSESKVLNNGVFDTEFFYRDGMHYEERKVRNVPEGYYGTEYNKVYDKGPLEQEPGWFCKTSTSKIII